MLHVFCWSDGFIQCGIAYCLNRSGTFVTSPAPGKPERKTCPNSTVTWWLTAVKIKYLPSTSSFFIGKAVFRLKGFEGHLLPLCVCSRFKIHILWHHTKNLCWPWPYPTVAYDAVGQVHLTLQTVWPSLLLVAHTLTEFPENLRKKMLINARFHPLTFRKNEKFSPLRWKVDKQ